VLRFIIVDPLSLRLVATLTLACLHADLAGREAVERPRECDGVPERRRPVQIEGVPCRGDQDDSQLRFRRVVRRLDVLNAVQARAINRITCAEVCIALSHHVEHWHIDQPRRCRIRRWRLDERQASGQLGQRKMSLFASSTATTRGQSLARSRAGSRASLGWWSDNRRQGRDRRNADPGWRASL
jgi:hypothetical protein